MQKIKRLIYNSKFKTAPLYWIGAESHNIMYRKTSIHIQQKDKKTVAHLPHTSKEVTKKNK